MAFIDTFTNSDTFSEASGGRSPRFDKEAVLAAMTGRYAGFYSQFTELKPLGGELRGPCPLHGGTGANFAVNPDTGLWNCFSGCQDGGDAFRFLEKMKGAAFPEALAEVAAFAGAGAAPGSSSFAAGLPFAGAFAGASGNPKPSAAAPKALGRIVAEYEYVSAGGELLFQALRYDPKDFRQRRPDGRGGWAWSLGSVPRVLYRLPDVLAAAQAGKPVYVCEGEKDADALHALGLAATTAPMGAKSKSEEWLESYTEALHGANVVILEDNDDAGRTHAGIVAAALQGQAKRVRVVSLPGLPDKGDVSDWLHAGGTPAALVQIARDTPDWKEADWRTAVVAETKPAASPQALPRPPARKPIAGRIVDLADVAAPTELPLLFGQYLLKASAHWLTGQTGLGKSTLVFNIACALAEGTALWGIDCEQTRILYCDMESGDVGRAHKIERLYRDAERVRGHLLFLREPIKLPEEAPELLDFVQQQQISLVIFDTARRCFSVKDENDNAEVYNRVTPTLDALKLAGIATLTLGHPSKNGNGSARGAGAQEDAGDVNLALSMHRGEVSDLAGVIALRVTKNRLLGLGIPPLFLRRIGDDQFERVDMDAAGPAAEEPVSKQIQCRQFIMDTLGASDSPISHGVLLKMATADGLTRATFERAWKSMKTENEVSAEGGGYILTDPYAD